MAVGVNARTAFSLLFPPILTEFGWDRGVVAGVFSFGFFVSAFLSPFVGRLMDRKGPRFVVEIGAILLTIGLALAPFSREPWQLYLTLGMLVGAGGNLLGYGVQSQFIPNWFVRRRGLAIGIAFSGVGIGSIVLLPWLQHVISHDGWRSACWLLALITARGGGAAQSAAAPAPAGDRPPPRRRRGARHAGVAASTRATSSTRPGPSTEWTLARALRTAPFWWIALGYGAGLYAWYAVQIHQTKYLTEIGVSATEAAWALGLVSLLGVPGQIIFGHVSDRIGREWVWAIGCAGFVICYLALIALQAGPTPSLLYAMVLAQGFLGYSMTSVLGPIVAEIYEGPHFGTIFGSVMLAAIGGGAAGPWVTGVLYDRTGNYIGAFWLAAGARPGLGRRRVHGRAAQGAAGCGAHAEMISAQRSARGRAEKWSFRLRRGGNDRAVPCGRLPPN